MTLGLATITHLLMHTENEYSYKDFDNEVVLITTIQPSCPDDCAISLWHLDQLVYQKNEKRSSQGRSKNHFICY